MKYLILLMGDGAEQPWTEMTDAEQGAMMANRIAVDGASFRLPSGRSHGLCRFVGVAGGCGECDQVASPGILA